MRRPPTVLAMLLALSLNALPAAAQWDPYFASAVQVANLGATARPFGIAAGDFDGDHIVDLVVGRAAGNVAFVKGNGDGTFKTPITFPWKQALFNAWAFAAGDVNGDDKLDVVWGANADSFGCSKPVSTGQTCAGVGGVAQGVKDG